MCLCDLSLGKAAHCQLDDFSFQTLFLCFVLVSAWRDVPSKRFAFDRQDCIYQICSSGTCGLEPLSLTEK